MRPCRRTNVTSLEVINMITACPRRGSKLPSRSGPECSWSLNASVILYRKMNQKRLNVLFFSEESTSDIVDCTPIGQVYGPFTSNVLLFFHCQWLVPRLRCIFLSEAFALYDYITSKEGCSLGFISNHLRHPGSSRVSWNSWNLPHIDSHSLRLENKMKCPRIYSTWAKKYNRVQTFCHIWPQNSYVVK